MSKTTTSGKTLKPMTPAAVEAAARADRDAQPLTAEDLKRMKRTPQAKIIRRALALTQEEFAVRYHIPLGTLRDWEQGRARPDRPTQAYLKIIACEPERVAEGEHRKTGGKLGSVDPPAAAMRLARRSPGHPGVQGALEPATAFPQVVSTPPGP